MSDSENDVWAARGFPLPILDSYGYTGGPDLIRTPMEAGKVRQRRCRLNKHKKAKISFYIDVYKLGKLEKFINTRGYKWFNMGLVTGEYSSLTAVPHLVRIVDNPTYGELYGDTIKLTLDIEIRQSAITIVPPSTSTLRVVRVELLDGALLVKGAASTLAQDLCGTQVGLTQTRADVELLFAIAKSAGVGYALVPSADPAVAGLSFSVASGLVEGQTVVLSTEEKSGCLVARLNGSYTCSATHEGFILLESPVVMSATVSSGNVESATVTLTESGVVEDDEFVTIVFNASADFSSADYDFEGIPNSTVSYLYVGGGGGGGTLGGGSGGRVVTGTYTSPVGWGNTRITVGGGGDVGEAGHASSGFGHEASGGAAGSDTLSVGGGGSAGPANGLNGGNGVYTEVSGDGAYYGGGGAAAGGTGGKGGGGTDSRGVYGTGGGGAFGKAGGKGLVILRLHRPS